MTQVPVEVTAIGTAEASSVIQVKSQIGGELLRVNFTEGGTVNKGDLLFEIDSRPIRETIRQAEAAIQRDNAVLAQAEATLARDVAQSKSVEADAARYEDLFKQGVGPRQQRDQAAAYQLYRTAVLGRGLSPTQRRLLFDLAVERLNLPLPAGDLQPALRSGW